MKLLPTPLAGVVVVETSAFQDSRGAFARWFCEDELAQAVGTRRIVQINHSLTRAVGAARGLHYQRPPHAETKFVRCLRGRVWDVALDLRADSPTFLQWHAEELSADNARMLVIPEGCAHGFQVLEAASELLYLHTAAYCPDAEAGVSPTDPSVQIAWPLPIGDLSARDAQHPALPPDFRGIAL
ncbi:dTDP-4-dehydrorhamnose 3,5-epimerase [Methylomonas sp. MED-D]|uniref:dTDP-4-dehydrorhamnose 3,5-epimerase n=1 Tax=unclassified Methylomonas TaxID=2608980 RepID=UPI0028A2F366|nr:dTDP-4-dehydrorhamnose 3,5-epimerase [Methylomonas sp. MV1]MDT4329973.1 dTDP-4-dehydrorhamnose 3,5-epimerase [Methylomonas sp. MV1]